jgi:biopolymer transport protein ExbB
MREASETERQILSNRETLLATVAQLEAEQKTLEEHLASLERQTVKLTRQREKLADRWAQRELEFQEIAGNVRVVARDLETMLRNSLITAAAPERLEAIAPLLRKGYFPDIDDISGMADLFLDEIARSGEVSLRRQAEYVNRSGEKQHGTVLNLGKFLAIYQEKGETGFLRYSPGGQNLFALSALPPWRTQRSLKRYLDGRDEVVPIDFSGGAVLRQITRKPSLGEQLCAGGPIVWPILLIGLAALVIVIERILFLRRVRGNTDKIMGTVNTLAAKGQWDTCENLVRKPEHRRSPVVAVILAGLSGRHQDRETLDSILQEAILHELPRLERFLSGLSILGVVAPLLGLLGTVTGMIDTFRVITLHGTGDPKLMSGGISEALITTELGLAVAIPIMLLHTFLSRQVDRIVGDMEEKAVALTNIIQKERIRNGPAVERH